MKCRTILASLLLLCAACTERYDKRLVHVLGQLRECRLTLEEDLPMVGGSAVGSLGTPHKFFVLMPYIRQISSDKDFEAMLRDPNPVVRVMAANCILKQEDNRLKASVDLLANDTARLFVAPFGCGIYIQTVSELITELKKNPNLLTHTPTE